MEDGKEYRPIACDFHDELEAFAVTRRPVLITESAPGEPEVRHQGLICDIYTAESKEEFLVLDQGIRIRLDRIKAVRPA